MHPLSEPLTNLHPPLVMCALYLYLSPLTMCQDWFHFCEFQQASATGRECTHCRRQPRDVQTIAPRLDWIGLGFLCVREHRDLSSCSNATKRSDVAAPCMLKPRTPRCTCGLLSSLANSGVQCLGIQSVHVFPLQSPPRLRLMSGNPIQSNPSSPVSRTKDRQLCLGKFPHPADHHQSSCHRPAMVGVSSQAGPTAAPTRTMGNYWLGNGFARWMEEGFSDELLLKTGFCSGPVSDWKGALSCVHTMAELP